MTNMDRPLSAGVRRDTIPRMGRIDESIQHIEGIADATERAFQMAGLISTLFKIKGVVLLVTGQLAFDIYANGASDRPTVDLAFFSGQPPPRIVLEVMIGQLHGKGSMGQWTVSGIPVRFHDGAAIGHPELCRDFTTDHGIVKLLPAEEIAVDYILASVYPEPDEEAQTRARLLLINGLMEAFQMDWAVLQTLCDHPDYRVGEELARMRVAAKKDIDAMGAEPDQVGQPVAGPTGPTEPIRA
jgi:hypothetical protein